MPYLTNVVDTFPSAVIPPAKSGLPVEVSLIAQLGHGAGSHLFYSIAARQKKHKQFIDALEEPSAKLGGTNFARGDTTALYSFIVGPQGHPFHRHAGHRIFTAVSGSGGAQLRFSTASPEDMAADPHNFVRALHFINIPPDCLFSVRFGGETWHQFWPLTKNSLHPVFFALSCHTDELGGKLSDDLKAQVKAGIADIPSLTEVLPASVANLINRWDFLQEVIPTTTLSLDAPAGTFHRKVCDTFRGSMGILRGFWSSRRGPGGYVSKADVTRTVIELNTIPENSLLRHYLNPGEAHHQDTFLIALNGVDFGERNAGQILELLLEGFVNNAPQGVSRLMLVRNLLVKPLGLRTSPLGCPVSSLLSDDRTNLFAGQYPVLGQSIENDGRCAQVVLGARDKHLVFRSCVGVNIVRPDQIEFTLGTGVRCMNLFGHIYMSAISLVHRRYISPTMLRRAADYLMAKID
jgi:hypothetical protein